RHRSAERAEKRNLVLFGEFPRKGMPPPEVALHLVLAASQNLFAVVAVILPGVGLLDAASERVSAAERLVEIDGVLHHGKVSDAIAVPNEVLDQRGLIALCKPVGANPPALEVRGVNGQRVAFVFSSRESGPGVLCPGGRVRTIVHPYRAGAFGDLPVVLDGEKTLGVGIALFPEAKVAGLVVGIGRNVPHALVLPALYAGGVPRERV